MLRRDSAYYNRLLYLCGIGQMVAWRQRIIRLHTRYQQRHGSTPVNALLTRSVLALLMICLVTPTLAMLAGQPVQAQSSTGEAILIDHTQNIKAMGYPDSRKIVRDSRGHLYVAYRKKYKLHTTTAYHIFVAKSIDDGLHWRVLNGDRPIEQVNDTNQRVPAIAIDSQDRLHVVWYGPDPTTQTDTENQIKYTRSTDYGETWSDWQNIGFVPGYQHQALWQEHPTIFIDQANVLYVVWEGRDEAYPQAGQIKFTKSSDGGRSWIPWRNIAPSKNSRSRPSLIAMRGNAEELQLYVVAYGSQNGTQQILYAVSADEGVNWSRWQPIAAARQDQRHVSAAVDNAGTIHVVWRQLPLRAAQPEDSSTQIYYASFTDNRWSSPIRVGPQIGLDQIYPSIAVDNEQTVWITWLATSDPYDYPHDAPTSGTLFYVAKTAEGWSSPLIYAEGNHNLYPSLRRDLTARQAQIDVVWLEAQPTEHAIRFAQLLRPQHFRPAVNVTTLHQLSGPDTPNIAWSGEADAAPFQLIALSAFLPAEQLFHDMRSLLLVIALVSLYVTIKFLRSRRRTVIAR